jgi:hypothetical protein
MALYTEMSKDNQATNKTQETMKLAYTESG